MAAVFFRSIIVFLTVFIVFRLMGKRQLGEMQPYELVVTLIIADLACIPMSDVSIPLIYGLVAILAIFFLHTVISLFSQKSFAFRKLCSGKPVMVISPNGIDFKGLKNLGMTMADLEEMLREEGYFSFDDVRYAIVETNGKISVVENSGREFSKGLPITIISMGKVNKQALYSLGKDENFLIKILRKENLRKIKDICVLTIGDGKIYYQLKNKSAVSKKLKA